MLGGKIQNVTALFSSEKNAAFFPFLCGAVLKFYVFVNFTIAGNSKLKGDLI